MNQIKTINDPIHGYISLPKYMLEFIDTPQFQRLRNLKQLGTSHFIFPGATNTRFEHCIGVSHLASKWLYRLRRDQPNLEINDNEIKLVSLAGLCHDLGHGPFSHAFENWVQDIKPGLKWRHEDMSIKMVQYLVDDNSIDIEKDDLNFVKELIIGTPKRYYPGKTFLFDIVSNSRNSIDVDKFDYLTRDSYYCGTKSSYDHERLIEDSRVINNEICYSSKEVYNIYELFHTRYTMHKRIYSHKTSKSIEFMIRDVLLLAEPTLKIFESIDDPERFLNITDQILYSIETSNDPLLTESKNLIKRIRKRKIYKLVDGSLIDSSNIDEHEKLFNEEEIAKFGNGLKPQDIALSQVQMNYAMKNNNPVDRVHFFENCDPDSSFSIQEEEATLLGPKQFSEFYLRLYVKDNKNLKNAQDAFEKFLKSINCSPLKSNKRKFNQS